MSPEPTSVPNTTKQVGEVRPKWAWTEPSVWTDRMLTALEHGVKGGKWFSLIDKVHTTANLDAAFAEVKANQGSAGVDHVSIAAFEKDYPQRVSRLQEQLKTETYHPQAVRRVWLPKPGSTDKRPLGIPTIRDRVVQAAVRHVIEPIFENEFAPCSYGFRPGLGCKDALREVDRLLKEGYTWVVDLDLKKYFDTIPHEPLMALVEEKIADGRILHLIRQFLNQPIQDGASETRPDRGTPQGGVISPLLANIYLNPLDHLMIEKGFRMIRYADDGVVLCQSQSEAKSALSLIQTWVEEAQLELHPEKTQIVDATQLGGFDFLGYHFERGKRWPSQKSLSKLKDKIRQYTRRCNGFSLPRIIANLNIVLRGWFEYFKHSCKTPFVRLDKWIRMRLRSILRKRHGGRGRGHGFDHYRWPNTFFAEQGLFSLVATRVAVCQSLSR